MAFQNQINQGIYRVWPMFVNMTSGPNPLQRMWSRVSVFVCVLTDSVNISGSPVCAPDLEYTMAKVHREPYLDVLTDR